MDLPNLDVTIPINVTSVTYELADAVSDITGAPNAFEIAEDLKNDIKTLTNLTRIIENTPIANFTERINWEGLEDWLARFGLDQVIDVDDIKSFAETIEETLENPDALIADILGFNLTERVEQFLDELETPIE